MEKAKTKLADLGAKSLPIAVRRRLQLIEGLRTISRANDEVVLRKANRQYALHLLESSWLGLQMLRTSDRSFQRALHWWDRLRGKAAFQADYALLQANVAAALCWLSIVDAREAGKLPAWEGILLVREQINQTDGKENLSPEEVFKRMVPEF